MDWSQEIKVLAALRHFLSLHEADAVIELVNDEKRTREDVEDYIRWTEKQYAEGNDTDIDIWYEQKGY